MTNQQNQEAANPPRPEWADTISSYLEEVETYKKEAPRSQCFTRLLDKLPFVPPEFVRDYNRGLEASLSGEEKEIAIRGEADALFGSVIVEFEKLLPKLSTAKPTAKLIEAQEQLRQYTALLWAKEPYYGRTRYIGIATDGVRFYAYSPQLTDPFALTVSVDDVTLELIEFADWSKLSHEEVRLWIDRYFLHPTDLAPTSARILFDFGPRSHAFRTTGNELLALWRRICKQSEFAVVYDQWERYLLIVYGSRVAADELFVRHTYLATLAKVMAWRRLTGATELPEPEQIRELLEGSLFAKQGLENFIEEDFFSWLARGEALEEAVRVVRGLFSLMQKYDLSKLSEDVLKALYQGLVDPQTRHDLGEYYTPDWLAHEVVTELLDAQPDAKLMDPTCGSGTFLYLAVREKRERRGESPETLAHILETVYGADIHPLAVIVAKTNYLLALGDLVQRREGVITLPVYMADTLRLPEQFMQSKEYEITLEGKQVFIGESLLSDSATYDRAIGLCQEFAEGYVGQPTSPLELAAFLNGHGFPIAMDKDMLPGLFALSNVLKTFLEEKRDSIWAFVLRNLYKPLLLRRKFDALMGNPPWIALRNTDKDYQNFLKRQIVRDYRLETRSHLITQMEVATLFLLRAAALYLKPGGTVGFVLPRSLFHADQHNGLRRRTFTLSEGGPHTVIWNQLWDCERVSPLFTVPSCAVFGQKVVLGSVPQPVAIPGRIYSGQLSERNSSRGTARRLLTVAKTEFSLQVRGPRSFWATKGEALGGVSPYRDSFENGATIFPRPFWFVHIPHAPLGINLKTPAVESDPRAIKEAKDAYKSLHMSGNVEARFLYASFLSADMLPFAPVDYRLCVLPILPVDGRYRMLGPAEAEEDGYFGLAKWVRTAEKEWIERRGAKADKLTLLENLNFRQKVTMQSSQEKYRVVYPDVQRVAVATILAEPRVSFTIGKQTIRTSGVIVENAAYHYETDDLAEAQYLCAVLNSGVIDTRLESLRKREQAAHPHVHKKIFDVAPIPRFDAADPDHQALIALTQTCAAKVQAWKSKQEEGDSTDIGVMRRKAREVIAPELAQIDARVQKILAPAATTPAAIDEDSLQEEYHDLVDLEMDGELSETQAARLRDIQAQLDTFDEQDPQEQAINARIRQTGDELDAMLEHLRSLPEKVS